MEDQLQIFTQTGLSTHAEGKITSYEQTGEQVTLLAFGNWGAYSTGVLSLSWRVEGHRLLLNGTIWLRHAV